MIKYISKNKLVTFEDKYHATIREINKGELSYSFGYPCTVTYCPDIKKYLVQDGNHRAIEKIKAGCTSIPCEVNIHVPKYYPNRDLIILGNQKKITIA